MPPLGLLQFPGRAKARKRLSDRNFRLAPFLSQPIQASFFDGRSDGENCSADSLPVLTATLTLRSPKSLQIGEFS